MQIYSLALHVPDHEDCPYGIYLLYCAHDTVHEQTVLSLLATCKLVNREAAGIFYRDHPLFIHAFSLQPPYRDLYRPTGFLVSMSAARVTNIRQLTVQLRSVAEASSICRRLATFCPKLAKLRFVLPHSDEPSILYKLRKEYSDLRDAIGTLSTVNELRFSRSELERMPVWAPVQQRMELDDLLQEFLEALPRHAAKRVVVPSQVAV